MTSQPLRKQPSALKKVSFIKQDASKLHFIPDTFAAPPTRIYILYSAYFLAIYCSFIFPIYGMSGMVNAATCAAIKS